MPKITITVEDLAGDQVKIEATPNFETIMKMDISGDRMTPAHGYAIAMLNRAREVSKQHAPQNVIRIPRVRYPH